MNLKTKINTEGIWIAYPLINSKWKKIDKCEIKSFKLRKYRVIREYGGYGIKNFRKTGKDYTIKGNIGLQLYLKNGNKVLIGTQKKQAIE